MDEETSNHTNTPETPDNEPRSEKMVRSVGDTAVRANSPTKEGEDILMPSRSEPSSRPKANELLTLRKHPPYRVVR